MGEEDGQQTFWHFHRVLLSQLLALIVHSTWKCSSQAQPTFPLQNW